MTGAESELFTGEFAPDGRSVSTAGADGTIRTWQLPTTILAGHAGAVAAPAIAGRTMFSADSGGRLNQWDLADPKAPTILASVRDPANARIAQILVSPDERLVFASTASRRVQIYLVESHRLTPISEIPTAATTQTQIALSPRGSMIAIPETDQTYQLWDIGDPFHPLPRGRLVHQDGSGWTSGIAFSPTGEELLTAGQDHQLRLWDITDHNNPRVVANETIGGGTIDSLAWGPAGLIAAGGPNGSMRTWRQDSTNTLEQHSPEGLDGPTVRSVTFTADGRHLAVTGDSSVLSLRTVDANGTGTTDLQIPLTGTSRWYSTISQDGYVLAAGGDGGRLQVIVNDVDYAARRICSVAGELSQDQWATFMPSGLPYRTICP